MFDETFKHNDPDGYHGKELTLHDCVAENIFQKTMVEFWDINDLVNAVNSHKCTIEFIYQYRTHFEQMWHCVLHSKKKPHYRDLHLHLPGANAIYHWNSLLSDCEWQGA